MICERCGKFEEDAGYPVCCPECGQWFCPACFGDDGSGICRACRREAERLARAALDKPAPHAVE